jgi:hypothetical protein
MTMNVRAATVSMRLGQNRPTFRKSEYVSSGRVRGWGNFTSGYEVVQYNDLTVIVRYENGDWGWRQTPEKRVAETEEMLTAYADWLSKWYDVTRPNDGKGLSLEIRAKGAEV